MLTSRLKTAFTRPVGIPPRQQAPPIADRFPQPHAAAEVFLPGVGRRGEGGGNGPVDGGFSYVITTTFGRWCIGPAASGRGGGGGNGLVGGSAEKWGDDSTPCSRATAAAKRTRCACYTNVTGEDSFRPVGRNTTAAAGSCGY